MGANTLTQGPVEAAGSHKPGGRGSAPRPATNKLEGVPFSERRWFRRELAADYMGMSPDQFGDLVDAGFIPFHRNEGRGGKSLMVFDRFELDAYWEQHRQVRGVSHG